MLDIEINCANINSVVEIREKMANELYFPSYYGHNWDVWDECMTDLVWIKDISVKVTLLNFDHKKYKPERQISHSGDCFETTSAKFFIGVIRNIQNYWDSHDDDNNGNEKQLSITVA